MEVAGRHILLRGIKRARQRHVLTRVGIVRSYFYLGQGNLSWENVMAALCRRGESAEFEVEACDAQGRLALPYELSYQPNLAKKRKAIGSL